MENISTKKFIIRLIFWLIISLIGPLFWWLGGGVERGICLALLTGISTILGLIIVTSPFSFPWEH